jgi:ABC-type nickel/cobalt efflux system permease component RcnA
MLRSLKDNAKAVVDLGIVLMIGIAFAGLMVIAYIIWSVKDTLTDRTSSSAQNQSLENITAGFDDAVGLLIVAITIFILALAISALLMLRAR